MDSKIKGLLYIALVLMFFSDSASADFRQTISTKASTVICAFAGAFKDIATGIAAVVMVIAGVKWVASENDPGARKAAKETMIHAIIGLLLINLIPTLIQQASDRAGLCGNIT